MFLYHTAPVFSAARFRSGTGTGFLQVPFDEVLADTVGGFDTSKTYYTANSTGLYLMHFSIGVRQRVYVCRRGISNVCILSFRFVCFWINLLQTKIWIILFFNLKF